MRRLAGWLIVLLLIAHPAAAQVGPVPPAEPDAVESTILGMSYGTAAVVAAGAVAGAVALNALAPNLGTVVVALYVAHWVVAGAVIYGASSWLESDETLTGQSARLLKD